jgi:CHAD domain-containing protein
VRDLQTLHDGVFVSAVVREALVSGISRLLDHEQGVRGGDDPEAVHQMRVATRRLRSDLRTFRPVLDEAWLEPAVEELKWLGGLLGAVRDADVLISRLQHHASELAPRDQHAARALVARGADQRDQARIALLHALVGRRYLDLVERLARATEDIPVVEAEDKPALDVVPRLVRRPWKRLRRAVKALGPEPADTELHRVRIRAKRARYAAEAAAPIAGKATRDYAQAMAHVQTVLGDHQDAVVAEEWLRREGGAHPVAALVAGQLIARERAIASATRAQWREAWRRASAKQLRVWFA